MPSRPKIRVLNGPNLNLLGTREPEIYGADRLKDIQKRCEDISADMGVDIEFFQSNHEGELVEWIQGAIGTVEAIIINAAAYTHTSVAIHDALRIYQGRIIEVHISNPHAREIFRHFSYVSSTADAIIAGLGVSGYTLAVRALGNILTSKD